MHNKSAIESVSKLNISIVIGESKSIAKHLLPADHNDKSTGTTSDSLSSTYTKVNTHPPSLFLALRDFPKLVL